MENLGDSPNILANIFEYLSVFGVGSAVSLFLKTVVEKWSKRKKDEQELKDGDLDIRLKHDQYWENRFKGLKIDYDSREQYHKEQYELLRKAYQDKEAFLQSCLDKAKNDYTTLSEDVDEINEELKSVKDELKKEQMKNIKLYAELQRLSKLSGIECSDIMESEVN